MLVSPSSGPLLFAHRGAATVWPENSLPALIHALDVGADALEIDVHMTRDGHPVVAHDPDGLRCAGVARKIADCPLAEVQRWDLWTGFVGPATAGQRPPVGVPTLEEVLSRLPTACLNVDVKQSHPDMLGPLLALIERFGASERVLLTSFSARTLLRIRRRGYPGPTGLGRLEAAHALLSPGALTRRFPPAGARLQIPLGHAGLSLDTPRVVARAHRLGLSLDYWVVNRPGTAARLLDLGADGIVTDLPEAIAPVFARHPRCDAYRARHGRDA